MSTMLSRVERHVVKRADKNYNNIKELCHRCKNLYNYCNYILRQSLFRQEGLPREYELVGLLTRENQDDYRALPAQTSQQVIKLLYKNWKQKTNIGKANNQNFVSLPHRKLIDQLVYKCEEVGIEVILTEEAYTSKIDHFVEEEMKHHDKYAGRRIHRGLYRSSTGILINADLNGALGIMRKVFPEKALALAKLIGDSGVAFTPVIVNPISCHVVSMKATNNLISFYTTKKVS